MSGSKSISLRYTGRHYLYISQHGLPRMQKESTTCIIPNTGALGSVRKGAASTLSHDGSNAAVSPSYTDDTCTPPATKMSRSETNRTDFRVRFHHETSSGPIATSQHTNNGIVSPVQKLSMTTRHGCIIEILRRRGKAYMQYGLACPSELCLPHSLLRIIEDDLMTSILNDHTAESYQRWHHEHHP